MRRDIMKQIVILAAVLLAVGMPLAAGVVFEVETTDASGSVETHQMLVQDGQLKMEMEAGRGGSVAGGNDAIFRGDSREMVVVDHDKKSYMVIDEEMIQQIGGQMTAMMEQMQKQMEGMDPQQRAMMEKMMQGQMGGMGAPGADIELPSIEFIKSSDKADQHGYPCVRYDVMVDGGKTQELWVTDWDNIEGSGEIRDAFKAMASFAREMMESMPQIGGGKNGGLFGDGRSLMEAFDEIDGFPVVTRSFGSGGGLENEAVLKSSTKRDLDAAEFEAPTGYVRRSMGPQ